MLTWVEHTPIVTDVDSCTIRLRADKIDWLVMAVARLALRVPVRVVEPSTVVGEVETLIRRLSPADEEGER